MYRGISALFVDKFAPSFDGIIPDPGDPGEGALHPGRGRIPGRMWPEEHLNNTSTPSFLLPLCKNVYINDNFHWPAPQFSWDSVDRCPVRDTWQEVTREWVSRGPRDSRDIWSEKTVWHCDISVMRLDWSHPGTCPALGANEMREMEICEKRTTVLM